MLVAPTDLTSRTQIRLLRQIRPVVGTVFMVRNKCVHEGPAGVLIGEIGMFEETDEDFWMRFHKAGL